MPARLRWAAWGSRPAPISATAKVSSRRHMEPHQNMRAMCRLEETFAATHGTAPKYAGLDVVNPGSLILSGVMLLDYVGWKEAGKLIVEAFKKTIAQKRVTYDFERQMQGATKLKTSEFASAII